MIEKKISTIVRPRSSLDDHLMELARIRDMAIGEGQLSVALNAEVARGKALGFYDPKALEHESNKTKEITKIERVIIGVGQKQ